MTTEVRKVALGSLAFALLFAWPIIPHLGQFGAFHDWEFATELHWVPYYTVVHFHQLPLWNPYKCGGMPMFANPQSRILTPFFLLHLITGPVMGAQLEIILHLALLVAGGYVLGRSLGMAPLGSMVCAAGFGSSSWFYLHLAEGHTVFLPTVYLPWVVAALCTAINRKKLLPAALGGLAIALIFFEGGLYVGIFAIILIATLTAPMMLTRRSFWPLWSAMTMALFVGGFAAIKLLPAVDFFKLYPRGVTGGEGNQWSVESLCLFSRNQDILHTGPGGFGFQEYGAYVSMAFVLFALCGAIYGWRRPLPWLIVGYVFARIAQGDIGQHPPWDLMRSEKFFGGMLTAMRLPSRFLIGTAMAFAVLAGFGADLLSTKLRRVGPVLVGIVLAVAVVDSWLIGPPDFKVIFRDSTHVLQPSPHFQQMRQLGAKGNMTHVAMANMGALECYEYTDIKTNAVGYDQDGYRGEQFLIGPGTVTLTRWTPNVLSFDLSSPGTNQLVVNQNYNEGWRISEGQGELFNNNGLIGVHVPAGSQHLTLQYHTRSLEVGLLMAFVGFVALWLMKRFDW